MKWTGLNQLRESYLSFFESKGHLRMPSAPLIPKDDNSILLINAGMTPLKKYFQGTETPPSKRVATCQKCIRTPDIDNVGITARHGTYFEMLGNFSFGDYFKKDAIAWAWEYFTRVLEIPADKLWITIYEEDDEAGEIWLNDVGVPKDRIVKMGKKDNFWEHGSGPCGPCSEIHYDCGIHKSCGSPNCKLGCECDRYLEIWNLVFTQFDSDGKGNYTPLSTKNIDTGMGLDRLACVMQGVDNMFEVDTTAVIIKHVSSLIDKNYKDNPNDDISIRIITDHIRSAVFMAGDGVRPSNEGRGYVMRRLLRRAARHGRLLGADKSFLFELCDTVINENKTAYPELFEKKDYIKKVIKNEEDSFGRTINNGLKILEGYLSEGIDILDGERVFKLHDTYGFPLDLTREILSEKAVGIDEEGFQVLMKEQKDTARKNQSFKGGWENSNIKDIGKFSTEFIGYNSLQSDTKILAIIKEGELTESISEGENGFIIIEKTPFYAESGGQIGDSGEISKDDNIFIVNDTKKLPGGQFVSGGQMKSGVFFKDDSVIAAVDANKRMSTARNHTAAHLLQSALREVLGEHVHQAGSYVDANRCRFDFSHFNAMTEEEIAKVEELVNSKILEGIQLNIEEIPLKEAQKKGAIALFGEKYGDIVRIVEVAGFSTEFCGGTHIDNTSKAGLFKIISESSVASGVRRIEAVTGMGVMHQLKEAKQTINDIAATLKTTANLNIVSKCEALMNELSSKNSEIDKLQRKLSGAQMADSLKEENVNGFQLITASLPGVTGDLLRKISDEIKTAGDNFIILIAGSADGKGNLLCKCGKGAIAKGANAGTIVRQTAAIAGGKGGGKPDTAMAGISDLDKINDGLALLRDIAEKL